MNDELAPSDSLSRVAETLRAEVPSTPGLLERSRQRRQAARRRQRTLLVAVPCALALALALFRPGSDGVQTVTFALQRPPATAVTLVGDFTDWQAGRIRLEPAANGAVSATVRLRPGRYRFAYVTANGEWLPDEHAALAADDFGRPTSVVTVVAH